MQSYKLRKSSETVLFPIENELKLLRQESDKNWTGLMSKILAVVISGIGTTVLCQKELLPSLVNCIYKGILKEKIPIWLLYILQILAAVGLFALLCFAFAQFINWKDDAKDNKKDDFARESLAEVFHKIILNNIITGKSFTKKAEEKLSDIEIYLKQTNANDKTACENQAKELKREFCLYLSEAVYYFTTAERQMKEYNIIEIGERKEYVEYLGEVGILTLTESLLMYEKSVHALEGIFNDMKEMDHFIWEENEIELLSIDLCLEKMKSIMKNVLQWKANFRDTIKNIKQKRGSNKQTGGC